MSIISQIKSVFGLGTEEQLEVDERELGDEVAELIQSEFELVGYEQDVEFGDEEGNERTKFTFLWRDESDIDYELTVATDTIYEGYAIELLVDGEEALTLREVPSSEVVETLREPFSRY